MIVSFLAFADISDLLTVAGPIQKRRPSKRLSERATSCQFNTLPNETTNHIRPPSGYPFVNDDH
jgi:hypothetical protein